MIQMIKIDSSNIDGVHYDQSKLTLDVLFKGGNLYRYFDVPEAMFNSLMSSDSKGKFFSSQIRGLFRFEKLSPVSE